MFKYNSSLMHPLDTEYAVISDRQSLRHKDKVHAYSRQEAEIATRINMIRDVMETLKLELSAEKDNLARERLETASMFALQSHPTALENSGLAGSLHTLPSPRNSFKYFHPAMNFANQNYLRGLSVYEGNLRNHDYVYNNLVDPAISDAYKEYLSNIERMCHEEFNKMQASIDSLRKIRTASRERDDTSVNLVPNIEDGRRLHRRHHRSRRHREGHHRDHRRGSPFGYISSPRVNEHRNHYYYRYNERLPKQRYSNRDIVMADVGEYSGDSTEMGDVLWHLDSPCNYVDRRYYD